MQKEKPDQIGDRLTGQALVAGKWATVKYPDLAAVQVAVKKDWASDPVGFPARCIGQVSGFLCSDQGYHNAWCKIVLMTADDLLNGDHPP